MACFLIFRINSLIRSAFNIRTILRAVRINYKNSNKYEIEEMKLNIPPQAIPKEDTKNTPIFQ